MPQLSTTVNAESQMFPLVTGVRLGALLWALSSSCEVQGLNCTLESRIPYFNNSSSLAVRGEEAWEAFGREAGSC